MTIRQPRNGVSLMRLLNDIHVIPINDFRDHKETEHCWCRPQRDNEEPRVVIHNALDGREDYENGRKQHRCGSKSVRMAGLYAKTVAALGESK